MKIRNGFVSNSSSSSFIICFDKVPESIEEMHSLMFPAGTCEVNPYGESFSSMQCASRAFEDLGQTMTFTDALEELSHGGGEDFPDYPHGAWDLPEKQREAAYTRYKEKCNAAALRLISKICKGNQHAVFYRLEYSDNDGQFSTAMEHGNVFDALNAHRVSHH